MGSVAPVKQVVLKAPELRGAILQLGHCHDAEVCIWGSSGTGKTFGILFYLHILLLTYPGTKAIIARKHAIDLAASVLATYQDHIIQPEEGISYYGGSRVKPAQFEYPNGSMIMMIGLDRPQKVRSMEVDIVYINEATECDIDDIEFCRMRLRSRALPWKQLIMDTNPDLPSHPLNLRMQEGKTTQFYSRHEDNPAYYDLETQDWTEEGRAYIEGILGGLTGVRRARYLLGQWAAPQGTVYQEAFDRSRNIVEPFPIPQDWPRYLVLDFGYTNPFVCHWAAKDPDGRLYIYRELYRTKTLVEDHVKTIKAVSKWGELNGDPLPRAVICDHDAEGRATFERHTGLMTIPAKKMVSEGIQAMHSRLLPSGDNKPRLMYFKNMLIEKDLELLQSKKPMSVIDEFDCYVWDTRQGGKVGENPVKEDDHGLDADRYLVSYFDLQPSAVRYSERIY